MPNIHHTLTIHAPAEKVYHAITTQKGLSGWWCPDTKAKPEQDSVARFAFGSDYFKEMKITQLKPSRLVKWVCLVAYEEWVGTTISFELHPDGKNTMLTFHHDDWEDYTEEFAECNYHWALFLRSLRLLCEDGKGQPYPNHLH